MIDEQSTFLLTPGPVLQEMAAHSIKLKILNTKNDLEEVGKGHTAHVKKNKGKI